MLHSVPDRDDDSTDRLASQFADLAALLTPDVDGRFDPALRLEADRLTDLAHTLTARVGSRKRQSETDRLLWRAANAWACLVAPRRPHPATARRWLEARADLAARLRDLSVVPDAGPRFVELPAEEVAALPICSECSMELLPDHPHTRCES